MAKTLQLLRGTTAQNEAFTGHAGELTVDTTTNELRLHDGSTAGGYTLAKKATTLAGYGITDGANTNLSNLTSTGANIGNWSSNVTNCITKIPQDINLTLSSGTLTLKAGSKAYKPDGTTYSATTDTNLDNVGVSGTDTWVIAMTSNNRMFPRLLSNCVSGAGATTVAGYAYDTTTNTISWYSAGGVKQNDVCSFPIAIIHTTSGVPDRIDQVFNGFGYVGSTIFVLPGVKGLIANGRNSDGTLKSTGFIVNNVLTHTKTVSTIGTGQIIVKSNAVQFGDYAYQFNYDENSNKFYYIPNGDSSWCNAGTYTISGTTITSFNPKTEFHALDYSDYSKLVFDVDAALSTKANDNAVVKLTGNQSIGGTKSFTGVPYFAGGVSSSEGGEIQFAPTNNDSNNHSGYIDVLGTSTNERIRLRMGSNEGLAVYNDGKAKCTAPAASSSTSDTWLATTGWVNDYQKSTKVVHREGDEVISGTKTFSAAAYGQASAVINSLLTTSALFKQSGYVAGYVKLGNGIIIQWGRSSIDNTLPTQPTNVSIVFPYAFSSNTSYSVAVNNYMNANAGGGYNVGVDSLTSTGFTYRGPTAGSNITNNIFWVAIGF